MNQSTQDWIVKQTKNEQKIAFKTARLLTLAFDLDDSVVLFLNPQPL